MKKSKEKNMTDAQLAETARLFGVLSDASRLRILRELMRDSLTVTELMECTGLKQGNLSKHLGILYQAGFLQKETQGKYTRYTLVDPTVQDLCSLMCGRIRERAKTFL